VRQKERSPGPMFYNTENYTSILKSRLVNNCPQGMAPRKIDVSKYHQKLTEERFKKGMSLV